MNAFYGLAKWKQWTIAILMQLVLLAIIILSTGLYLKFPLSLVGIIFIVPLMQFLGTPFNRLMGIFDYVSPMLLIFTPYKDRIDLHNGTTFDYLMVLRKYKMGAPIRSKILEYYIEGLLEIMYRLEKGQLASDKNISGTSYFFSDQTAERLGFTVIQPPFSERINLYLNFVDLILMYSIGQGRLAIPNMKNIKKATITPERLISNKLYLQNLHQYLKNRNRALVTT